MRSRNYTLRLVAVATTVLVGLLVGEGGAAASHSLGSRATDQHASSTAPRAAPGVSASDPLWGVDTASYAYDVLGPTEKLFGKPQVFGRYVTTNKSCNGNGLSGEEVSDLFRAGISIFLIDYSAGCGTPYMMTGPQGTAEAKAAAVAAAKLGVPKGVGIFEDVEWNDEITTAYMSAFYGELSSLGYLPGFYAQTSNTATAHRWFLDSYCTLATGADPAIQSSLYWASAPTQTDETGRGEMPAFDPNTFTSCASDPPQVVGWQYARVYDNPKRIDIDTDEWASTEGLWEAPADGDFLDCGGKIFEIVGGAPLPVPKWSDVGGRHTSSPGTLTELDYLDRYPANGTVLRSAETGDLFTVEDGAAISTPGAAGKPISVDQQDLDLAGTGGIWDHLAHPAGFWLASADGTVSAAGQAEAFGSLTAPVGDPVVGVAATPDGAGYWEVTREGAVGAFGDARSHGDLPDLHVSVDDIVGIAPTSDGGGYWLIGADGGEFAFGDAGYHGSLPGIGVHVHDVVGMVATPDGKGYILVAADGGVFVFGGQYHGSLPGLHISVHDIVGILPTGGGAGYVLVGADGGAFVFGHGAGYYGSLPGIGVHVHDIVGIALSGDEAGYWMAEADGATHAFGDAASLPTPAQALSHLPVAAIAGG